MFLQSAVTISISNQQFTPPVIPNKHDQSSFSNQRFILIKKQISMLPLAYELTKTSPLAPQLFRSKFKSKWLAYGQPYDKRQLLAFGQTYADDDDEYDNFYGAITQHMPLQGRLDKETIVCQRYDFSK